MAALTGISGLTGLSGMDGSFIDPYPDFPTGINLVDAWLANLSYMFQDTACSTPVTAAAQAVKGWRGRNGNIFAQPTTGNAPVSDLTSSIWALTFASASSRYMTVTLAVAQPTTIYTVAFQDNEPASSYQFDGIDTTDRQACIVAFDGTPTIYAGSFVGPPAMPAAPYAFAFRFNGASGSIRSAAGNTAGDTGALGVAGYTLGARFSLTQFYNKRIRALIVCNAAHSTGTQDTVLAWLRTNFGAN